MQKMHSEKKIILKHKIWNTKSGNAYGKEFPKFINMF